MKKDTRPTFYLDNNKEKPIRAGGVLIYKMNGDDLEVLISENEHSYGIVYEDLGGCTDNEDFNYIDTIVREAYEESNKLIKRKALRRQIENNISYLYSEKAKYVVYIVEATKKQEKMVSADFGDKEEHDGFNRKIKWIKISEFCDKNVIKNKLHFRLKNPSLFTLLQTIQSNKRNYSKNLLSNLE
jgi:hypothetical protein